ncbi:hypothetical protein FQR65_LT17681 [Abscondita terminalis]|nr:hypothetical protein FQR65_LT17681 [Abscondita terminalis]
MLSANSSRRVNSERAEGNNRRDNALSGYSNTTLNSSSSLYIDDLEEEESDSNDNINEITHTVEREMLFPSINELSETETIYISRSNCLNDILNIYQNQEILTKLINVVFLDEIGVDGGGLTKEMFNIFFSTCAGIYFHGEDCLVPHLDLNRLNDLNKFVIIGRVLQHMITLTNSVPTKLSKVTLMLISDPQKEIDPEVLITELEIM